MDFLEYGNPILGLYSAEEAKEKKIVDCGGFASLFVEKCIEAARLSPTARNLQPLEFVVVHEKKNREAALGCIRLGEINQFFLKAFLLAGSPLGQTRLDLPSPNYSSEKAIF